MLNLCFVVVSILDFQSTKNRNFLESHLYMEHFYHGTISTQMWFHGRFFKFKPMRMHIWPLQPCSITEWNQNHVKY